MSDDTKASDEDAPVFPPPLVKPGSEAAPSAPEAPTSAPAAEAPVPVPDSPPAPEPATATEAAKTPPPGKTPAPANAPFFRKPYAELAAIASGLLYFLAFAGFDIWPLTFVAFVPLYLALFGQTPKRATWLGFLTGLAMNLGGFYWLVEMLKTFSGFPLPLCILFTTIVCAYQGSRLALMGWLHGRAQARGWPTPLVFVGAFAASELVYPLLFPWYYAATVHNVPVLMQLADIAGPILPGVVLVAVNLAIAEPIRARLAGRAQTVTTGASEERRPTAIDKRVIGAGVIALVVALVYGAVRISLVNARAEKAESAHVGYVQANMGLLAKRQNPGEGMKRHLQLTNELRAKNVDLVIWSETSAMAPAREELAMRTPFFRDRFAGSLKVPTIFGAVLYKATDDDDVRYFNSAIAVDAKGEVQGRYDKQYLLAFGEYLPFGSTFPILYKWSPHSGRFQPGTSLEPMEMDVQGAKHKISVLICYEDILPGFTNRAVSHADPDLLVNMTNDAWFGDTLEPWQHLSLAKFRAIEHRRFFVRSTNSGVSAVIDPVGKILPGTTSKPFTMESHDATIRWMRGTTVYELVGDVPWYLVSLAMAVVAFRRRKTTEPSTVPAAV